MIEVAEESEPVLCTLLNLPAIQGEPPLPFIQPNTVLIKVHSFVMVVLSLSPFSHVNIRFISFFFAHLKRIANTADLQALDLYALLTTLPKTEELEEPEASAARPHELDVSMDNSVGPSLDERGEQTTSVHS